MQLDKLKTNFANIGLQAMALGGHKPNPKSSKKPYMKSNFKEDQRNPNQKQNKAPQRKDNKKD